MERDDASEIPKRLIFTGILLLLLGHKLVVFVGVLNGTLEARDLKTGELLWNFQTEASKQNKGWVLTSERKFNSPFFYYSNWRERPFVAIDQQQGNVGGIFSSPLVANGVVYFGSADGYLYALE